MSNYYCPWCLEVATKEPCEHCDRHESDYYKGDRKKGKNQDKFILCQTCKSSHVNMDKGYIEAVCRRCKKEIRAERLKGCCIRHLRTVDKDRNSRGVTVVCRPCPEEGITRYGLSYCSPRDTYSKAEGIDLALDRLDGPVNRHSHKYKVLPWVGNGWYLWAVLANSFNKGENRHGIYMTFRNTYMTWDLDHDWHLVQRKGK